MSAIHMEIEMALREAKISPEKGLTVAQIRERCGNSQEQRLPLSWWESRVRELRVAVGEDRGVYEIAGGAERGSSGETGGAAPAPLGEAAVSLSADRLFGCEVPSMYREVA